ncbi:MAG: histidine kinase dimerization/phospho-acceptor domain-containing protein, partial [Oscillospiraceae bacterium]
MNLIKFQMTLSLRMRLTLITSLLLTIMCALFTAFSIYNANNSIQVAVLTEPSYSAEVTPAQQIEPSLFASEEQISLKAAQVSTAAFSQLSIYFMVGAIMMGSLIMYFISGIILKPLQRLSDVISKIDRDALHTRITEFHAGDELNILSDSFNSMLERLDLAFAREKRFSVDAAHELKTPLTVVKTTLEVLEMDAPKIQDENLAEYNEAFAVMKTQTERMNVLVNQLFAFSAMGGTLQRESVRLDQLVRSMQTQVAPLCTKAQITVREQLEI